MHRAVLSYAKCHVTDQGVYFMPIMSNTPAFLPTKWAENYYYGSHGNGGGGGGG